MRREARGNEPVNRPKATPKPRGTPIRLARSVDAQLTLSDTPIMATISASIAITSPMADRKLSNTLKVHRAIKDMTQEELAEKVNLIFTSPIFSER